MKNNNRKIMKMTMKHKNEKNNKRTIVQQSFNNAKPKNTPLKHDNETQQRKTTSKHTNDTERWKTITIPQWNQQWNTWMKKQQSFNNEKTIKHTNETRQWNTKLKNNIQTQQLHIGMKSNNRRTIKTTMKQKNGKTTIVQQSFNNEYQWNRTMKNNIETAMTHRNEKQQSYYNEKTMKQKNVKRIVQTFIQKSFNSEKPIKHTNETRQWNRTTKNNIETHQWHSAMKTNNRTTMETTMKQ